jgi:hypothetical protein
MKKLKSKPLKGQRELKNGKSDLSRHEERASRELTDEELEQVRGGMQRVTFSIWRARTMNGIR